MNRLRWIFATGNARDAEILALRHQILVLQRQINRPHFTDTDRTILGLLGSAMTRKRHNRAFLIVKPDTVLRWHRRRIARHWTEPPNKPRGRPPIDPHLRRLTIQLATENPTWEYRRIHGELHRIGHSIAASTVWKILKAAGINPIRDRTGPSWSQFISSQAKGILATDFACVDTASLRRFHVGRSDQARPPDPTPHHLQRTHQPIPASSLTNSTTRMPCFSAPRTRSPRPQT